MSTHTLNSSALAWEFLRKNTDYQSDQSHHPSGIKMLRDHPFPLYQQDPADMGAAKWGLLAYEAPHAKPDHASPFWAIGPTLEAEVSKNNDTPLLTMLHKSGARVSGLQCLDGSLLLRLEQDDTWAQVRLRDGHRFSEHCSMTLRLPMGLHLPVLLARSLDIWNIINGERVKKAIERILTNCFSPLTA